MPEKPQSPSYLVTAWRNGDGLHFQNALVTKTKELGRSVFTVHVPTPDCPEATTPYIITKDARKIYDIKSSGILSGVIATHRQNGQAVRRLSTFREYRAETDFLPYLGPEQP